MLSLEAFERCERRSTLTEATLVDGSEIKSLATCGQACVERCDCNQRLAVTPPFSQLANSSQLHGTFIGLQLRVPSLDGYELVQWPRPIIAPEAGRRVVTMKNTDRREFLQLLGMGAMASTLNATVAKALEIPANDRTRSFRDVEHIVILMQENRPFDHHFGTLKGVRGYNDPRAVNIHLPLLSGNGTTLASVFLQPAGVSNVAAGYGVPPNSGTLGGPADGVFVIPPFRVDPKAVSPGLTTLGLTYLPGTDHGWSATHLAWNQGQYDSWASVNGPIAMSYMTREDIPYHYALADAFTVGDAYHCSIMGPTNPNRTYLWSGCVGNLDTLGLGGTDGPGSAASRRRELEDLPGPRRGNLRARFWRRHLQCLRRQLHRQFRALFQPVRDGGSGESAVRQRLHRH
jgi:hypothetical protein